MRLIKDILLICLLLSVPSGTVGGFVAASGAPLSVVIMMIACTELFIIFLLLSSYLHKVPSHFRLSTSMVIQSAVISAILLSASFTLIPIEFYLTSLIDQQGVMDSLTDLDILFYDEGVFVWQQAIFGLILIVICAPIVEEIVFRHILLNRLASLFNASTAVIVSSIIFAALHSLYLDKFIFGVVLCLVYMTTKNIWIPIFIHFLNNAFVGGFILWDGLTNQGDKETYTYEMALQEMSYLFVPAVVCLGLFCWLYIKVWGKPTLSKEIPKSHSFNELLQYPADKSY